VSRAVWSPDGEYVKQTRLFQWMNKLGYTDYDAFYRQSIDDISWFWEEVIKELDIRWEEPYRNVLDRSKGIQWPIWFEHGKLNVTTNAVEKWLHHPYDQNKQALIYENEQGDHSALTYGELAEQVRAVAQGLVHHGLRRGDRVLIYMPLIPESVVSMLAIARVGAIFTPVFSGFAADAVQKRIEAAEAKFIITADGFTRRGKVVNMKEVVDQAVQQTDVERVFVVSHVGLPSAIYTGRDVTWHSLLKTGQQQASDRTDNACDTAADDPFMLIYTSGTTSKPKGIVHTHAGFPLKAAFDAGICMDLRAEDTMLWITDMGWMMGPFLVFGTLLNGSTMVLYDGSPDHPHPYRIWELVDKHRVTHLGLSPTFVRSLMKHDIEPIRNYSLESLKLFGSTGEPWNDDPWLWLFEKVGQRNIPIFNYSGGTEISGGIFGNVLVKPIAPVGFNSALPGMAADVFDQNGQRVTGEVGELVLKQPWVGMANGFWQEPERYLQTYWSRWPNVWLHGDWVKVTEDGYWYITGRSDDTLNIAGKRLGPAEMESLLVEHPLVKEAATIGAPHPVKGEVAVCFVVLYQPQADLDQVQHELMAHVEQRLGKALKPAEIHVVQDLPKTRNAKIMRRVIRSAYLGHEAGDLSALENPETVDLIQRCRS
jgi:acetyl-CoA synthetase